MSNIISNVYFKGIINNYLNKNKLNNISYCDVDTHKRVRCIDSKIASQLTDINSLSNKKLQYENLVKYLNGRPDYLPLTISFTEKNMSKLKSHFTTDKNNIKKKWIIKPENSLSRRGIVIIDNYQDLQKHISNSGYGEWIFQQYIDNPLLIDKKKFHFRLYVIVVQDKEKFEIYIYKKGFMYFAKKEYNINKIEHDTHLSGESSIKQVMVYPEDFTKHFSEDIYNKKIVPQFAKIARETILSVKDKLICINEEKGEKCFKFFGYDVLVDKDYKLYLAEINARIISLKYPPSYFKKEFYEAIMDLVIKNKQNNKLIQKVDTVYNSKKMINIEGFTNRNIKTKNNKTNIINLSKSNYKKCIAIIILLLIALVLKFKKK